MKKTLLSAFALMILMTACHENERIIPQVVTTTAPSVSSEPREEAIPSPTADRSQALPAAVSQNGQPGEVPQPAGRDGAVGSIPAAQAGPVSAVMPADTLAMLR